VVRILSCNLFLILLVKKKKKNQSVNKHRVNDQISKIETDEIQMKVEGEGEVANISPTRIPDILINGK